MEPRSGNAFEQPSVPVEYGPPSGEVSTESVGELSPELRAERAPVEQESAAAAHTALTPVQVVSLPAPAPVNSHHDDSTARDDLPSVAADDDLIEKEWVDKAKKIIAETKDDPYKREREINRLQADYLKKRYGKVLGSDQ